MIHEEWFQSSPFDAEITDDLKRHFRNAREVHNLIGPCSLLALSSSSVRQAPDHYRFEKYGEASWRDSSGKLGDVVPGDALLVSMQKRIRAEGLRIYPALNHEEQGEKNRPRSMSWTGACFVWKAGVL
jgi:hypothetical protein